jgi:cell division septum initiation protein DivIVA
VEGPGGLERGGSEVVPTLTESRGVEEAAAMDEAARSLVGWSRSLAGHYGGRVVRLNHLFLAFIEERQALESCVNEVLQTLMRALGTRHEWVDALPGLTLSLSNDAPLSAPPVPKGPELPFSEDYRHVLERARSLAVRLGDGKVGAKHLLISLFSDELRQFREKFLAAGSSVLLDEARDLALGIVEAARTDAARIVQNARRDADKILERAETDALRAEVLVKTKEEILRLVARRNEGWTLSGLSERLGVSWQSLIWPVRQLVAEGRLAKRGKLYRLPESR